MHNISKIETETNFLGSTKVILSITTYQNHENSKSKMKYI